VLHAEHVRQAAGTINFFRQLGGAVGRTLLFLASCNVLKVVGKRDL
jgi:hypothetical protein